MPMPVSCLLSVIFNSRRQALASDVELVPSPYSVVDVFSLALALIRQPY